MTARSGVSLGVVGALIASYGVALLAAWGWGRGAVPGPADPLASTGWGVVWSCAALALLAVACLGLLAEPRVSVRAAWVAIGWVSPLLAATPGLLEPVRAVALGLALVLPLSVVALPAWTVIVSRTVLARAAVGLTCAAVLIRTVAYNPMLDPSCVRYCVPLGARLDLPLSAQAQQFLVASLVTASALALLAAALDARSPRSDVVLGATAGAASLVPWWVTSTVSTSGRDDWLALAVGISATGTLLSVLTLLHRRRAARKLLAALDAHQDVPEVEWGQLIEPDAPALRLALENARLRAEARSQVEALRDSRRRIVEAFDAERRRFGRDLHDTVQQRVVGALIQTRIALDEESDEARRARLLDVVDLLTALLPHLRDVTERSAPELVETEGLGAAIAQRVAEVPGWSLASEEPQDVADTSQAARSAYVILDSMLDAVAHHGPGEVRVSSTAQAISICLRAGSVPLSEVVADRIAVANGTVARTTDGPTDCVEVVLPCGS